MAYVEMPEEVEPSLEAEPLQEFREYLKAFNGTCPTPEEYAEIYADLEREKEELENTPLEDREDLSAMLQDFLKRVGRPPESEEYTEMLAILQKPEDREYEPSDDMTPPVEPVVPRKIRYRN